MGNVSIVDCIGSELHLEREPKRCRFKSADEFDVVVAELVRRQAIILVQLIVNFVDRVSDLVKFNLGRAR